MRTLGTSHSRAMVKIIQGRSLPPTLEICEFRFDVNNEQHDLEVSYIATKRIFWLCTKIFCSTRHSFKIMNLCVHFSSLWRVIKDETNFNFIFWRQNNGHTVVFGYLDGKPKTTYLLSITIINTIYYRVINSTLAFFSCKTTQIHHRHNPVLLIKVIDIVN
jgi:hypothetical protein